MNNFLDFLKNNGYITKSHTSTYPTYSETHWLTESHLRVCVYKSKIIQMGTTNLVFIKDDGNFYKIVLSKTFLDENKVLKYQSLSTEEFINQIKDPEFKKLCLFNLDLMI